MFPLKAFSLRPRLVGAFVFAAALAFLLPGAIPLWSKGLIGWCAGVSLYVILIAWQMSHASVEQIRSSASELDDSAPVILVIAMAATAASFGAIAALLLAPATISRTGDIVLAGCTMVLSWTFIQAIFSVHYTHMFYGDVNGAPRGGLKFGGDEDPDFWDFVYFTTSVGATAQTSDTMVCSRTMRRTVAAQAVYSFFFNTAVLAMAVNVAAGLAGH